MNMMKQTRMVGLVAAAEQVGLAPESLRRRCVAGLVEGCQPDGMTWIVPETSLDAIRAGRAAGRSWHLYRDGEEIRRPHGYAWGWDVELEAAGPMEAWGTTHVARRFDNGDLAAMLGHWRREVAEFRQGYAAGLRVIRSRGYLEARLTNSLGSWVAVRLRRQAVPA